MPSTEPVQIPDIDPTKLQTLRDYMAGEGGSVTDGDNGVAENECFSAKFTYDEGSKLLTLEPTRLVDSLTPVRLADLVQQITRPPAQPMLLASGEPSYTPEPYACATYNWAIGFITNNSGKGLTYSDESTQNGNLEVLVAKIPDGDGPSKHQDGFWRNKESKDSTTGCFGSISYQLSDGVTTLTITYGANVGVATANAALKGNNADRYVATWSVQTNWSPGKATEYTYPYVTLAKV